MIKIVKAEFLQARTLWLEFSDGTAGAYDLRPLIARGTEMVTPLEDNEIFAQFFMELGALCWPNGFELSGSSIAWRLREQGKLYPLDHAV